MTDPWRDPPTVCAARFCGGNLVPFVEPHAPPTLICFRCGLIVVRTKDTGRRRRSFADILEPKDVPSLTDEGDTWGDDR